MSQRPDSGKSAFLSVCVFERISTCSCSTFPGSHGRKLSFLQKPNSRTADRQLFIQADVLGQDRALKVGDEGR